jgi:hypothetical protein
MKGKNEMNNIQSHVIKNIKFESFISKNSGELIKVIFFDENDINVFSHFLVITSKIDFLIQKSEDFFKIILKDNDLFMCNLMNAMSMGAECADDFLNRYKNIYLKEVKSIEVNYTGKFPGLKSIKFL